MILVSGGRGSVARAVVTRLRESGHPVRIVSRKPDAVPETPGVEVVAGDLANTVDWTDILRDVTSALVYADPAGIGDFVAAASKAGVEHLVLLSADGVEQADAATGADPIVRMHRAAEQDIANSALSWTFVRAGSFATNSLQWSPTIRAEGVVRAPYPNSHSAPVHEADVADVISLALTEPGHAGHAYRITGPTSLTQREQVAAISAAIGKSVEFQEITAQEYRDTLSQWGDAEMVDTLVRHLAESDGNPATISPTFTELTGYPGRGYAEWASDHADAFR